MIKRIILIVMIISIKITLVTAYTGGSGSAILMMDSYGARQIALGDVFVGIANDINTISVNPAGINRIKNSEISMMYMQYFLGMNLEYLAGGMPLPGKIGVIGAGVVMFNSGEFDFFDELGNKEANKLSAGEWGITLSYANNFLKDLDTGINVKLLHTSLVDDAKTTVAIDIGLLYRIKFLNMLYKNKEKKNFGIGLSVQNIGSTIQYKEEDTELPQNIRIGIGYQIYDGIEHSYLLGLDVNIPNDSNVIMGIGLEYGYNRMLYGRIGYKMFISQASRISGGIGIKYPIKGKELIVDYGIKLYEELGAMHTVSIGLKF